MNGVGFFSNRKFLREPQDQLASEGRKLLLRLKIIQGDSAMPFSQAASSSNIDIAGRENISRTKTIWSLDK